MNNFSVKNINIVGAVAALWAFIFTFLPFYKLKPTALLYQNGLSSAGAQAYTLSKNLVSYNFFGVLCLILAIVAIALYVWNGTQMVTIAAIGVSVLDLICMLLALIVGNGDIKTAKEFASSLSSFGISSDVFFKSTVSVGFFLELIMILIMIASYWINELVVKPYVWKDNSGAKLNPLDGLVGTAKATYTQTYAQQPVQPQGYAQAPQQPVQPQGYAQAPQQPVQNQGNNVQ